MSQLRANERKAWLVEQGPKWRREAMSQNLKPKAPQTEKPNLPKHKPKVEPTANLLNQLD